MSSSRDSRGPVDSAAAGEPQRSRSWSELPWQERLAALRTVRPMLALVWRTNPRLVAAILALRVMSAVGPVASLWVWMLVVNAVVDLAVRGTANASYIWTLVAIEAGLAVASDAITRMTSVATGRLAGQFELRINLRFMEHASRLDLASFESPEFQETLARARHASGRLALMQSCFGLIHDALTLVLFSLFFVTFSPWLMVLLVGTGIPVCLAEAHFSSATYLLRRRRATDRRMMEYLRVLGSGEQSAKESRVFGLGGVLTDRYQRAAESLQREEDDLRRRRAFVAWQLNLLATAGFYGGYAAILSTFMSTATSIGTFMFMTRAFSRSRSLLDRIVSGLRDLADEALLATDFFDYFTTAPTILSPTTPIPIPQPIRRGIDFEHVSFAYPGSDRLALRDISLHIDPNERLALVGENGAGKTTLVKLMTRLYEPTSGRILLDGIDLREYDPEALRHEVGVVFQDFMRYQLTARDNIGFGDPRALDDDERLEQAAQKSLAADVIERFSGRYDQMLGRLFEGGEQLSGGEWQRIALARAYMRNAQILVLDEPTSSLDPRSEYEHFKRFAELTRGKMVVLISHRFSTVRMADRIVVLEQGAIREEGTHHELVSARGNYSSLFALQAETYR